MLNQKDTKGENIELYCIVMENKRGIKTFLSTYGGVIQIFTQYTIPAVYTGLNDLHLVSVQNHFLLSFQYTHHEITLYA